MSEDKGKKGIMIRARMSDSSHQRLKDACRAANSATLQAGIIEALEMWMDYVEREFGRVVIQRVRPPTAVRRKSGN